MVLSQKSVFLCWLQAIIFAMCGVILWLHCTVAGLVNMQRKLRDAKVKPQTGRGCCGRTAAFTHTKEYLGDAEKLQKYILLSFAWCGGCFLK